QTESPHHLPVRRSGPTPDRHLSTRAAQPGDDDPVHLRRHGERVDDYGPGGNITTKSYDAVGRLSSVTDDVLQTGNTTTYDFDLLDRVLSRVPDPSLDQQQKVSFTYTQTGQRLSMTDKSGTTNYSSHDNRDRLKTKITPEGTLSYTYDAHGNVKTIASSNVNGASMTY